MKLRVCFKDHYPCRAETCGEYDVCKVRLAKEKLTARKAIAIHNEAQKAKLKGAIEYKRYLKQVIEDYGIEKNDALRLAMGENLLQIVAKYEAEI